MSKDEKIKKLKKAIKLLDEAADVIESAGYMTLMSVILAKSGMVSEILDELEDL